MKVAVTGATGMLGSHVVKQFADAGYEIVPVTRQEVDLTNAVETLLKDDSLRAVMSQAGRRFAAEKFSLSVLAKRHEDYYLKILSGQRPRQAVN